MAYGGLIVYYFFAKKNTFMSKVARQPGDMRFSTKSFSSHVRICKILAMTQV